jgi:hypothetical protein
MSLHAINGVVSRGRPDRDRSNHLVLTCTGRGFFAGAVKPDQVVLPKTIAPTAYMSYHTVWVRARMISIGG